MDAADRREQLEMVVERAVAPGEIEQGRGARVLDLVHGVPESGYQPTRRLRPLDGAGGEGVPPVVVARPILPGEGCRQELGGVLGHPQEPRSATEQPGGQGAL